MRTRHVLIALTLMARQRLAMRKLPGLTFYKLMGTGSGKTFTVRDADIHHWCVLSVWKTHEESLEYLTSKPARQWVKIAAAQAHIELEPLSAKGTWAKQAPFGNPVPEKWDGLTAALTRASIKPRWWREFWRSVPPVSTDLNSTAGLITSLGIGEAPIGLQGTFSIWESNESITAFSSKQKPHAAVIARTHETGWYSEELFARFKVTKLSGSFAGLDFSTLEKRSSND
ncbi:MAG: monooxygenase [Actinobacteria bacterium]|nr:monooxygenase [Actinomycetota bacterium]